MPPLNTIPPHFSSLLSSEALEITAESGKRRFFAHNSIFDATKQGPYKATPGGVIDFPDWDGDTVERFLQFLYIGNYQFPEPTPEDGDYDEGRTQDGANTPDTIPSFRQGRCGVGTPDTAQSLADWEESRDEDADVNVLLVHARLYVLAQIEGVEALQGMALERLEMALSETDSGIVAGAPGVMGDVIKLLEFVYSCKSTYKNFRTSPEEPMQNLVSSFAAKNFVRLMSHEGMKSLLCGRGDFAVELVEKVAGDLKVTLGGVKMEVEGWKCRVAALEEKERQLEAKNVDMAQRLEAMGTKVCQLEADNVEVHKLNADSAAKVQQLESKILQLEAENAEKVQQLEAANARIRVLEAANSHTRGSETEHSGDILELESKIRQLEIDNAEKVQELDAVYAEMRFFERQALWFEIFCPVQAWEYVMMDSREYLESARSFLGKSGGFNGWVSYEAL